MTTRVVATEGSPYCGFEELVTCPSVRPSRSVTVCGLGDAWVLWRTEIAAIDATRSAESIGEGISTRGGAHIPQPENPPVSRYVTLLSRLGCSGSSVALRPLGVLLVIHDTSKTLFEGVKRPKTHYTPSVTET